VAIRFKLRMQNSEAKAQILLLTLHSSFCILHFITTPACSVGVAAIPNIMLQRSDTSASP
jgi:hypothetical protein